MIKTTQITIPKLKITCFLSQYLSKSNIFIRWNPELEFAIYKFNKEGHYQEYRISLLHLGIEIQRISFIESNQGYFLLGSGGHENLFTIFVLGLQNQELVFVKIIKMDNVQKFDWVKKPNYAQVYKLQGCFNVIDFSQFPHVEEYTFATNVSQFDILHFQSCKLLKLQRNTLNEYYLLPLTKNSRPVIFNQNMTKSIFLRERSFQDDTQTDGITKIKQIYFLNKKRTVGHYFSKNHIHRFNFSEKFGTMYDSRYWLKIIQIQTQSKIIRKISNIINLYALQVSCILCRRDDSQIMIYDFTTGQHSEMEAPQSFEFVGLQIYINFLIYMDLPNRKLIYAIEER